MMRLGRLPSRVRSRRHQRQRQLHLHQRRPPRHLLHLRRQHLHSPFGVALVGNDLYVANTDGIVKYPYKEGDTEITAPGTTLTELPGGPIDHHWTKSLVASTDGSLLYVGIGSNSNITENGIEAERDRAAIWQVDRATGRHRIFASGLRNQRLEFRASERRIVGRGE
jgi:glucose/arabinose dehydrogenase